tara:strand:+ start:2586 stop:2948 length:363 start_codon:yes stop_codon:yes gene_type:complete
MKKKVEGLGDQIEKFTKATGIKKLVKWMFGEDCGCDERQEKLNKLFPKRRKKPECLNESEYNYLKYWFDKKSSSVTPGEQKDLLKIYNRVFHDNKQMTSCGSCIRSITNELKSLYNAYGN